jgi:lipopolysaccharide/colanic/teichoic acid biosynthesis glycosyltransferase
MIYPKHYFAQRLQEEKILSDQTGKPFSVVVISMDKMKCKVSEQVYFSRVLEQFLKNTRLSDSLGWFPDGQLGLILPNTEEAGAQNVITRLQGHFGALKKSTVQDLVLQNGIFSVIEYPKTLAENMILEMKHLSSGHRRLQNRTSGLSSKLLSLGNACFNPMASFFGRPKAIHSNYYSKRYFRNRIKEEKIRVCRTGTPFLVILVNPSKLISSDERDPKFTETWVKLVDKETNGSAVKGWWDRKTIGILVHNTSPGDISLLIDKLINKLRALGYPTIEPSAKEAFRVFTFQGTKKIEANGEDERKEERLKSSAGGCDRNHYSFQHGDLSILHNLDRHHEIAKQILDILASVNLLACLSPLFLLCAILIKIDSPGPVFYKQRRIGKGGKPFTLLKFRSMDYNADEKVHEEHIKNLMNGKVGLSSTGNPAEKSYKLIKDERVSRFGKFLRKSSIDELPQLINVLRGDMSLVGPRPHPPYEVELYKLWQSYRLNVKPGITGLGQVYGRYNKNYEDVYRLDFQYLKTASLLLDLKILFKTIFVVLSNRGAY